MRNIIFDFNGTLYQDTPLHFEAWRQFLSARNIPLTEDGFYRYMCGPPNSDILRRFIDPNLDDGQVERLSEEKENIYRDIILGDPSLQRLAPGAEEMLDTLKGRGIPCAIATGADHINMDFYMKVLKIDRWFDYGRIACAHKGLPGKPDPAIYRLAMEKINASPAQTVVVEDAVAGIRAAAAAGVGRIIAIDTTLGRETLSRLPEVHEVIHDFYGFERYLDEL